jgi:hypothetical protein
LSCGSDTLEQAYFVKYFKFLNAPGLASLSDQELV